MHEDRLAAAGRDSNAHYADPRLTDTSHALGAGARIDRFDIVDLIGGGTSGFVYLAFDHALGRHVALREYLPRPVGQRGPNGMVQPATPQQAALFAAGLRSFASEALVLARIDSPSLAKVLRYWEGNGTGYAAMPFYEGMTLQRAVLERRIAVDDIMLRALLAQLLDAVEAVHRAQSCHGKISPSDILIRADGRPLLLEFDAARTVLAEMTDSVPAILKPGYAPVELYPGMKDMLPGAWSDVYSLGAVGWFLITGKEPPPAPERLRNDRMRSAREAGHGKFSPGLLDAIDRALAVRLEQRPPSAAALRDLIGAGRAANAYPARAENARDAIRRERETMATRTAEAPPAPPAPPAPAPVPPVQMEQPAPAAPPVEPQLQAQPPEPQPPQPPLPPQPPQFIHHDLPPIQGEWRKVPMVAERREMPPRRRSMLPGVMAGSLTLCAGVVAGVLIGYPELIAPAAQKLQAVAASVMPARSSADAPSPEGATLPPASTPTSSTDEAPPQASAPAASSTGSPAQTAQTAQPARTAATPPTPQAASAPRDTAQAASTAKAAVQEDTPAKEPVAQAAAEQEEWRIASSIDQPEFYESYLKRFPDGQNAASARAKLAAARQARSTPAPAAAPERAGRGSGAAAPSVEERSARAASDEPRRMVDAPRYPAGTMSPPPAGEGQKLSGDFTADPESGALSGIGQVTWPNGDRYEGRLVNGSKEGKGQFIWQSGQRYNGDWANNQPNGRGTIVFADGNRYEGEVRNGLPNGRGVLAFSTGGRYEGEVKNGVPNGRGLMVFADGTRYEGEVRDGLPHGQGVTRFRNGDVYSGTLAKGISHGQGRFSWANGLVWEGEFRDGLRTNNGRLIGQARTVASSGGNEAPAGGAGE